MRREASCSVMRCHVRHALRRRYCHPIAAYRSLHSVLLPSRRRQVPPRAAGPLLRAYRDLRARARPRARYAPARSAHPIARARRRASCSVMRCHVRHAFADAPPSRCCIPFPSFSSPPVPPPPARSVRRDPLRAYRARAPAPVPARVTRRRGSRTRLRARGGGRHVLSCDVMFAMPSPTLHRPVAAYRFLHWVLLPSRRRQPAPYGGTRCSAYRARALAPAPARVYAPARFAHSIARARRRASCSVMRCHVRHAFADAPPSRCCIPFPPLGSPSVPPPPGSGAAAGPVARVSRLRVRARPRARYAPARFARPIAREAADARLPSVSRGLFFAPARNGKGGGPARIPPPLCWSHCSTHILRSSPDKELFPKIGKRAAIVGPELVIVARNCPSSPSQGYSAAKA